MCVVYLITEADRQLVEADWVGTVGPEEDLELDRLIHMEAGSQEAGLTLD